MTQDIILKLLVETYKYYPIGMPKLTKRYNGYRELLQIVEDKIVNLQKKSH